MPYHAMKSNFIKLATLVGKLLLILTPKRLFYGMLLCGGTRWFKYDRDCNRLVYTQISPGHIWTTLFVSYGMLLCGGMLVMTTFCAAESGTDLKSRGADITSIIASNDCVCYLTNTTV